jgi:hypothetical protein
MLTWVPCTCICIHDSPWEKLHCHAVPRISFLITRAVALPHGLGMSQPKILQSVGLFLEICSWATTISCPGSQRLTTSWPFQDLIASGWVAASASSLPRPGQLVTIKWLAPVLPADLTQGINGCQPGTSFVSHLEFSTPRVYVSEWEGL